MSLSTTHDLPELCLSEGLDCTTCTSSTARDLARTCPGLPGKMVAQLFVQIHVHTACLRMHRNFARAYDEALRPAETMALDNLARVLVPEIASPHVTRKPVPKIRLAAAAAVA